MIERFEMIDRKVLRESSILTYCEDTLKAPDGKVVVYDNMLHKGAAAVVPVLEDGRILMVKQFRHSIDRVTLEIPAGKRDDENEDFALAAARELEEETGYHSDNMEHLITIITAIAYCNEKIEVYLAKDLKRTHQTLDDDEFIDVYAFTTDELKEKILKGEIQDSKTIAAIMSYISTLK
ncbi:MAG: NUDIX hydrolase [Lachnospiraceae bacterium]|nr:NUDIX hydrolase [Lachnospiraceae bacterium]